MPATKLEPKLFSLLKEGYSRAQFGHDLAAGVIVGIVALPLAIAFAIASGVKPEQGLYTAIIAGFLISVLSGSRVQIGGPTGAFIVLVYRIVQDHGYEGLAVATFIAGFLLVAMGIARLGSIIKFIPYPVIVGFTNGIALIIALSQIRDLLGLRMDALPADFLHKLAAYQSHFPTLNPYAVSIGLAAIAIIVLWPRVTHRIPSTLIAILLLTGVVHWLKLPVATIGSQFGAVPSSLPTPHWPMINAELVRSVFPAAVTIALLAGIESLLSAVVADGMTGRRHRSNMELIAQGVANIFSPLFGGIPATGAIARTATNIKNGGRTPVAGIVHAITLALILLFFGKWAALIPMPVLAAILLVVAYNMGEWHLSFKLFRGPKEDILVLLTTFLLTVLVDLTVAIEVGVVLAALLFMYRMANVSQAGFITQSLREEEEETDDLFRLADRDIPNGVEVFEINGPFFFGAADQFKDALHAVEKPPAVLILRMRHVPHMDATGLRALEDIYKKTRRDRTMLFLSGMHPQPLAVIKRAGLMNDIGPQNLFTDIDSALKQARTHIATLNR